MGGLAASSNLVLSARILDLVGWYNTRGRRSEYRWRGRPPAPYRDSRALVG